MSFTKRFLEVVSTDDGYGGEINNEVMRHGQKILTTPKVLKQFLAKHQEEIVPAK